MSETEETLRRAQALMELQTKALVMADAAIKMYLDVIKRQDARIRCLEIALRDERGGL